MNIQFFRLAKSVQKRRNLTKTKNSWFTLFVERNSALYLRECNSALYLRECNSALYLRECSSALYLRECNSALYLRECNSALYLREYIASNDASLMLQSVKNNWWNKGLTSLRDAVNKKSDAT